MGARVAAPCKKSLSTFPMEVNDRTDGFGGAEPSCVTRFCSSPAA
jgi:hypothetical protein